MPLELLGKHSHRSRHYQLRVGRPRQHRMRQTILLVERHSFSQLRVNEHRAAESMRLLFVRRHLGLRLLLLVRQIQLMMRHLAPLRWPPFSQLLWSRFGIVLPSWRSSCLIQALTYPSHRLFLGGWFSSCSSYTYGIVLRYSIRATSHCPSLRSNRRQVLTSFLR